ncbi:ISEc14 transposase A [Klebsiella quasipneumoniae]|nr:ISEc14 transposase A [Klebsiella quasipneumoniae]VGH01444.1 ISEc14 transposase A [Klebsiella pneumoniae]VGH61785.1 ISEc14 transposase A [Klebsiella quasipneumoniae]
MSGKRYPEEFKTEAVKQVVDRGYSVASVATRLDITTHSLYAWIKKYGPDSSTNKEQSDAQAEIRKRAARTVLTGMCYSVGSATRQGSSSPTRFIGQSAMTSRT